MIVSLETEFERKYRAVSRDSLKLDERPFIRAKPIDALPGRQRPRRHEALPLDSPVSEYHHIVTRRKEIGLAFESRSNLIGRKAQRLNELPVYFSLAGAGG